MKNIKGFVGILAVLLVFGQVTAFAASKQRTEINKFLKAYEDVVVAAEKAAKSNKIADLIKVQEKALKLTEQAEKIQNYEEWTTKDSEQYLKLTNRYAEAMTALTNTAAEGGFSF
jgi:DNA-binding transcriptional regulator GbsR (MarR family)